jgi:hypothetical protein
MPPGGIRTRNPSKRAALDRAATGKLFLIIRIYLYSLMFLDICTDHLIYRILPHFLIISFRYWPGSPGSFDFRCQDTNCASSLNTSNTWKTLGCCFPVMLFRLEFQTSTALLVL